MTIATSTKTPERFTPASYGDDPGAPVYLIAVPGERDKIAWRAAIGREGGRYHSRERMLACLRRGIREVVVEEQQAELLEIVDRYVAAADRAEEKGGEAANVDEELQAQLDDIEDTVAREYPPFRDLCEDRRLWLNLAPLLAATMFLVGWENVEAEFPKRRHGQVPAEVLEAAIPAEDFAAIGVKAMALMSLDRHQKKG